MSCRFQFRERLAPIAIALPPEKRAKDEDENENDERNRSPKPSRARAATTAPERRRDDIVQTIEAGGVRIIVLDPSSASSSIFPPRAGTEGEAASRDAVALAPPRLPPCSAAARAFRAAAETCDPRRVARAKFSLKAIAQSAAAGIHLELARAVAENQRPGTREDPFRADRGRRRRAHRCAARCA